MKTTRILLLLSLALLLLTGLNLAYAFISVPSIVTGMVFGVALGGTIRNGWDLLRGRGVA